MHYGMCSSISLFCLLDVRSSPIQVVTRMSVDIAKCPWGWGGGDVGSETALPRSLEKGWSSRLVERGLPIIPESRWNYRRPCVCLRSLSCRSHCPVLNTQSWPDSIEPY